MPVSHNCGVYIITAPSGSRYIGSSMNIADRWRRHLTELRTETHNNPILIRAFKKYGRRLKFEKLIICDKSNLILYEQLAMNAIKPEYNLSPTAGSNLGIKYHPSVYESRAAAWRLRKHSRKTKKLIGLKSEGRKQTEASLKQRSETLRKTMALPEVKARMIAAAKRRGANKRTCKKISKALKGRKKPPRKPEHTAKIAIQQRGSRWINNGKRNRLLKKNNSLPKGWTYGRIGGWRFTRKPKLPSQ